MILKDLFHQVSLLHHLPVLQAKAEETARCMTESWWKLLLLKPQVLPDEAKAVVE